MPSQSKVSDGSTSSFGQDDPRVGDRGDADRQVDQEDPVPRGAVDQRAAEDRAEDRAEQHRDAEHGHHATDALGAGGAGQDRHAERHQHAAAEALQDAEEHQHLEAGGGRAEHRAGGEQQHGEQVEPLGAEAVGGPAGQRDDAGQGQRVAGHRPGDLGRGGVELALEGLERDGHDRDVEDGHDRAEDDDARDEEDVPVELVGRRPPGCRRGAAGGLWSPANGDSCHRQPPNRFAPWCWVTSPGWSRSSIRARLGPRCCWISRAPDSTSRITRSTLRQVSRARSSADQPRSASAASSAG